MTLRKSTIQDVKHHYRIKRVAHYEKPHVWKVYRDGYSRASFATHELALSYAIERTSEEHEGDWMLLSTIVDSQWIMFVINQERKILMPVDKKNYQSMDRRQAKKWLNSFPMPIPLHHYREEVYLYNDDISRLLRETMIGEWVKYEPRG
jgi:hypothetical protein